MLFYNRKLNAGIGSKSGPIRMEISCGHLSLQIPSRMMIESSLGGTYLDRMSLSIPRALSIALTDERSCRMEIPIVKEADAFEGYSKQHLAALVWLDF